MQTTRTQKRPAKEPVRHPATGKFPKSERLCSRKEIEALFAGGKTILAYPLKCTYVIEKGPDHRPIEEKENHNEGKLKLLVIVPKRNHKKAVARNPLRRRMREAYRRNRNILTEAIAGENITITMAFSYISKQSHYYAEIEHAARKIFQKLGDLSIGTDS